MAFSAPSRASTGLVSLGRVLSGDTQVDAPAADEAIPGKSESLPYRKFSSGYFPALGSGPQLLLQPWNPHLLETIFANEQNFKSTSSIGVLKATSTATNWWPSLSYKELVEQVFPAPAQDDVARPDRPHPHTLVLLVVYLEYNASAHYQRQASISRRDLEDFSRRIEMHDAAIQDILGRPDYWSAVGRRKDIGDQRGAGYEFFCQHPRWLQKSRHDKSQHRAPCSIYLHHNGLTNTSTYVIAAARHDGFVEDILQKLGIPDEEAPHEAGVIEAAANPFLIHALVSGIAYQQSTDYMAHLRKGLFDEIAQVNDYSKESYMSTDGTIGVGRQDREGRKKLETITKNLHLVSQTCDSGIANANMSIKLCEEMLQAYLDFSEFDPAMPPESWRQVHDSLEWILKTWHCQKNWLISYKARKDTAMNFVYNLVTQQDNSVNIDIAHQAAQHSSSMNAITILTMVFLPGTFIAGVFGSGILDNKDTHGVSDLFLPFIWLLLPLTVITMALWFWRGTLDKFSVWSTNHIRSSLTMQRQKSRRLDVEQGPTKDQ